MKNVRVKVKSGKKRGQIFSGIGMTKITGFINAKLQIQQFSLSGIDLRPSKRFNGI